MLCIEWLNIFASKENLVSVIWKGFLCSAETLSSLTSHISKEDFIHEYLGKVKISYFLQSEYLRPSFCLGLSTDLISVNQEKADSYQLFWDHNCLVRRASKNDTTYLKMEGFHSILSLFTGYNQSSQELKAPVL